VTHPNADRQELCDHPRRQLQAHLSSGQPLSACKQVLVNNPGGCTSCRFRHIRATSAFTVSQQQPHQKLPTVFMCCQVPCSFAGGVVVKVDRFRPSAGGWVRLLFKNVNGAPVNKVELSKVSAPGTSYHATESLPSPTHLNCLCTPVAAANQPAASGCWTAQT